MVAIVASYWRKDTPAEEVAKKLGLSVPLVENVYGHVALSEAFRREDGPSELEV